MGEKFKNKEVKVLQKKEFAFSYQLFAVKSVSQSYGRVISGKSVEKKFENKIFM